MLILHSFPTRCSSEKNSNDALIASVARSVPRSNGDVSLLIAPAGVMLSHSTVTVNNPIFWVSHRDFRESLVAFRQASWVQVFDIIQFLFWQNEMLFKEASSLGIKDNQMKEYFEENRQMIF